MVRPLDPEPIGIVRRQFSAAASRFDRYRAVFDVASERLLGRLDYLAIEPARVLDLGCRTGYQLDKLQRRYPSALILGADPAADPAPDPSPDPSPNPSPNPSPWGEVRGGRAFWHRWRQRPPVVCAADPHHLPFADESFDLVISNLLLPWCESFEQVFRESSRVLAPGGAVLFSSAGPDTLIEYRRAWADIDAHLHAFGLFDMHDLGDAMLSAGLAEPVLDRENLTVDYPDIDALQVELQGLGAVNLAQGRRRGLMNGEVRSRLRQRVKERSRGDATGLTETTVPPDRQRFGVTLELLQGHAWKGTRALAGTVTDEGYRIGFDDFRRSLKSGK